MIDPWLSDRTVSLQRVDALAISTLILSGIAALAGVMMVLLWFVDRRRQNQERPIPAVHVRTEPIREPWVSTLPVGQKAARVVVTNAGDGLAMHFEVESFGDLTVLHHHEDPRMAALPPGGSFAIPVAVDTRTTEPSGVMLWWVHGSGRRLKADTTTLRWQGKAASPSRRDREPDSAD